MCKRHSDPRDCLSFSPWSCSSWSCCCSASCRLRVSRSSLCRCCTCESRRSCAAVLPAWLIKVESEGTATSKGEDTWHPLLTRLRDCLTSWLQRKGTSSFSRHLLSFLSIVYLRRGVLDFLSSSSVAAAITKLSACTGDTCWWMWWW